MQQYINNSYETSSIVTDLFPHTFLGQANIPTKRYFFNTSLSASINTIFKFKEYQTLNVIADYNHEENSYSNYAVTDYFISENERLHIIEQNQSDLSCHKFNAKLNFENNSPDFYLNNQFALTGKFNDNNYYISKDSDISQQLHSNDIKITNSFNTILRRNNKVLEFSSEILIANTPQNYIQAVDINQNRQTVNQNAEGLSFHSHEKTAFSWLTSNLSTIGVNISFKSQYDCINTTLVRQNTDDINNDNSGYKLITTTAPYYQYKNKSLTWRLDIPVCLYNINYTDVIDNATYRLNRPYIDITSSLYYNFPYNIKTSLRIGQSYSIGNISDFIVNPIYTTYKQQSFIGSGALKKSRRIYATFSARYRNTVDGVFLSSQASLSKTENNRFYSSIVNNDEIVTTTTSGDNTGHIAFVALSATKNIYDWDTSFSLNGNAQFLKRHSQRQSAELDIHNRIYNINATINNSFLNNRIVSKINCLYTISTQSIPSSSTESNLNDFTATFNLSVFPIKAIEIYTKASYINSEIEYNIRKKDLYLDAGLRFINPKWQIDLNFNNITNRKSYSYSRFDEYDIYSYRFTLRPIECILSFKYNY